MAVIIDTSRASRSHHALEREAKDDLRRFLTYRWESEIPVFRTSQRVTP